MFFRIFVRLLPLSLGLVSTLAMAEVVRFAEVEPGLFRGGQPTEVVDYAKLQNLGIRTILNLREEKELVQKERAVAAQFGIRMISIPMNGFLAPSRKKLEAALDALHIENLRPLFVHCQHGKDRTGLVVGLHRVTQSNWTKHDAYREMRSFGFNPLLAGLEYTFWRYSTSEEEILAFE